MSEPINYDDLQRWGNAGRRSGWGQREDGYWTPWHIANDAIIALRSDNDQLREQVEAFRREQNARSKIDPVTRLHNLCDHLAEQRRESPFTAESLELADASYKELCAENAALREQVAAKETAIVGLEYEKVCHENAAEGYKQFCLMRKRAEKAEAENAALRKLLLRWLQIINRAKREAATVAEWDKLRQETDAMLAGKEGK